MSDTPGQAPPPGGAPPPAQTPTPGKPPGPGQTPPSADPFALWRQIYEVNEQAWNAALERNMATPAFAEASGKVMETFLAFQKTVRENMRQYLETINVPTREDIARLGRLIVNLEEKIDQLDERLDGIEATLRREERPPEGARVILPGTEAASPVEAQPAEGPQVILPSGEAAPPAEPRVTRPRTPRAGGPAAEG